MQNEEPLRPLTEEEFERLRASIRESRKPPETRLQVNAKKIAQAQMAIHEEGLEIGLKVWNMRKVGRSKRAIQEELGISDTVLENCLREFETRLGMEAGRMAEHYRLLDDERLEDMIATQLPVAVHGRIRIEHVRNGEVYSEVDFDRPLKAGYFVLHCINTRLKMLAAARPESGAKETSTNVLVWLQQTMPGITKIVQQVQETPFLDTETDNAPRDEAREGHPSSG